MIIKSQIAFLKSILYLAAVVECRSVTKAAEQNGIKQANLSRMMRDLEETIAQPLFVRKSTGLVPTETAMVLYRHALMLQKNLEQAQSLKMNGSSKLDVLKFYKPDALTLGFMKEFSMAKIKYVAQDAEYHVGIFYENPHKNEKGYQTGEYELNIAGLTQKIWIVCQTDNPKACALMDFIISRLFV
jgi:hypothetical protein